MIASPLQRVRGIRVTCRNGPPASSNEGPGEPKTTNIRKDRGAIFSRYTAQASRANAPDIHGVGDIRDDSELAEVTTNLRLLAGTPVQSISSMTRRSPSSVSAKSGDHPSAPSSPGDPSAAFGNASTCSVIVLTINAFVSSERAGGALPFARLARIAAASAGVARREKVKRVVMP